MPASRRLAWPLVIAVAAALALWPAGAPAGAVASGARASRAGRCLPRRREILRRVGASLLFVHRTGPSDGKYGAPHSLYGCRGSHQRPVDLFDFEDGDLPSTVVAVFDGAYAAFYLGWEALTCVDYENAGAENCGQTLFESVNLSSGRVRVTIEQPEGPAPEALVVTRAGWIAWTEAPGPSAALSLFARDAHGERTLDPGPVDPRSLRLSGGTVRWTDAGLAHSAVLG